ncbi:copper resistance CopC family protein [Nocardioides daphniae]|uniref:Copper resistance protein CopC n=1 Tax=Nocardioides daphniae TaxID=402297 RepID=A0A4P7U8G5_9ACTN|nr:copper resistance CopC family protein [Nocardioides daphniae]QCC76296.1 copper resistance protein CopC [Nocardioides daphniae]GGD08212.1 hypothetical protein GCM10007231_03770 [Nocardioides daphniae]
MTRTRRPSARPRVGATVVAVVAAAATVLLGAAPALAHAGLTGSSPEDGTSLTELPTEVVLTFSEEVRTPATVVVTGPDGAGLQSGEATVEGDEVRQPVERGRAAGEHTIAYRVISSDGHPITGQVRFTLEGEGSEVGVPNATPSADPSADAADAADEGTDGTDGTDGTWSVSWLVAGGVLLVLVLLLAGGALGARAMKRQRRDR